MVGVEEALHLRDLLCAPSPSLNPLVGTAMTYSPLPPVLRRTASAVLLLALTAVLALPAVAQFDLVLAEQKISDTVGGFDGMLDDEDRFGSSAAVIGDLDNDGVQDLAVGARGDDDGADFAGAVWILFLNADGTVKAEQKISDTAGGFMGDLDFEDGFGVGIAGLDDLDGDGVEDIAVGSFLDDDGGGNLGAVYILFLNPDGTVKAEQKISDLQGGFSGNLDNGFFGSSVASIGDFDDDGVQDIAVGSYFSNDGGARRGAVWLVFLNADGTVKAEQKISETSGGFMGDLDFEDRFGRSVAGLGDLDGDGIQDLAVGALTDDDGGTNRGAVWILFLNADGTVKAEQKISDTAGGFDGELDDGDNFGQTLALLDDRNGDGVQDLAVGAHNDDEGGLDRGAVWILLLNSDGTVKAEQKISDTRGGFSGNLGDIDLFGYAVANLGDLNGDGKLDLATGAIFDDDAGTDRGAVYILFLDGQPDLTAQATSLTTVAPGGSVSFVYAVTNENSEAVTGSVYFTARDSTSGAVVAQGIVRSGTLEPGQTVTGTFTQRVPSGASPGIYTYTISAGGFPDNALDAEVFTLVVTPSAARPGGTATWAVTDASPWVDASAPALAAGTVAQGVSASPNPFASATTLRFALEAPAAVRLVVYDALGREVARLADGPLEAGAHAVGFDGSGLPSGVYVWRLEAGSRVETGRLTLLR